MEKATRKSKSPLTGAKARKKDECVSMLNHYPWLKEFDKNAKERLTTPEVTNVHVLKLMTFLESNVSSEVSKLRNRPNRATKFLGQFRKRVSMTKVGGYMIGASSEKELFPTYGLLMTHIIDITLMSSMVEKFGAQCVASDLYYFLRLMFNGDKEFILDVILCSTLDEHANTKHQVGFQLFSYIVEDWRCFCDTHSGMMKYCAIASLLFNSGAVGRVYVERNLPVDMDKTFPKYLEKTIGIDLGLNKGIKSGLTLKCVVEAIRATAVKPISRNRLVIVTKRGIHKLSTSGQDSSQDPEQDSDADSTSSTVVHAPSSSRRSEQQQPSSSSSWTLDRFRNDPMNLILGDLGMLDTSGDHSLAVINDSNDEEEEEKAGVSQVSSSNGYRHRKNQEYSDSNHDETPGYSRRAQECHSRVSHSQNDNGYDTDPLEGRRNGVKQRINDSSEQEDGDSSSDDDEDGFNGKQDQDIQDQDMDKVGEDENVDMKMEDGRETDGAEIEDQVMERSRSVTVTDQENLLPSDSDSEIVILEEVDGGIDSEPGNPDSPERDEADAESGEDVVPNYDIDSSEMEVDSDDNDEDGVGTTDATGNRIVAENDVAESKEDLPLEEVTTTTTSTVETEASGKSPGPAPSDEIPGENEMDQEGEGDDSVDQLEINEDGQLQPVQSPVSSPTSSIASTTAVLGRNVRAEFSTEDVAKSPKTREAKTRKSLAPTPAKRGRTVGRGRGRQSQTLVESESDDEEKEEDSEEENESQLRFQSQSQPKTEPTTSSGRGRGGRRSTVTTARGGKKAIPAVSPSITRRCTRSIAAAKLESKDESTTTTPGKKGVEKRGSTGRGARGAAASRLTRKRK